jgi:2-dehydro-3-deoxygluconokinase
MINIAVIGECMVELYEKEEGIYQQTFGGDSFNCAVYLKRCLKKAKVEYITVLGKDNLSNKMLSFFHKENLLTSYVEQLENKNPGLYIINTKNGERSFEYWRGQAAAKELFVTSNLEKLAKDLMHFDMIYFSAITLAIMGEQGRDNFFKIIKKARAKGVKIVFDSNYRPRLYNSKDDAKRIYEKVVNYTDIFLPSIDDEIDLWGESDPLKIIEKSLKSGIEEIIITCGKEDIVCHYDGVTKYMKTKQLKNIIDSTSAGDSFNGQYLASRLKEKSIKKSVKKAKKLASKVIMHKGAIIPNEQYD